MSPKAKHLRLKPIVTAMGVVTGLLLVAAMLIGIGSLRQIEEIVARDLSTEQLILARSLGGRLGDALGHVRRELTMLGNSPALQYLERVAWASRMRFSMDELSSYGAEEIRRYSVDGRTCYVLTAGATPRTEEGDFRDVPAVVWATAPAHRGQVFHGAIEIRPRDGRQAPIIIVALPVYQVSVDDSHPAAPGGFDGTLAISLRLDRLVGRFATDARDGHSGYAWVVADDGRFLFHPDSSFVGQDAFTARSRRDPAINYERINRIQKTRMLRGEEGTSWYTSGWHLRKKGEIKKYIAYSPVEVEPNRFWSVAVAVPAEAVARTVRSLYLRQFFTQGVLIVALLFAAMAIIGYERRWSAELEAKVKSTTFDLQQSNAELRQSEEKYRSVVENARDFILVIGQDGALFGVNQFAANALATAAPELVGKNLDEVLPGDAPSLLQYVRQALHLGRNLEAHCEVRIRNRAYRLSCHFVPMPADAGAQRVLVIARDIADRQRFEEVMFRTEKLASLGKLAAGVAHEINNPIAVILGFTELLLEKATPGTEEHETLTRMERQGLACKRIVENLLTFARLPDKAQEHTDVNDDVDKVLEMVAATLSSKKIELQRALDPSLPRVRADSAQLQQVFLNIVNNAVAAMPEGGSLSVGASFDAATRMVEVAFTDTGTGIAKEHAHKVFDPFFTTKKAGEGTGLGLSVSHAIISKFGGGISFDSRTVDGPEGPRGTTFFVSLLPVQVESKK